MTIQKIITLVLFFLTLTSTFVQGDQSQFFVLMKKFVTGSSLSNWDIGKPICQYKGVGCDERGDVIKINISAWYLSGQFPSDVCSYLPRLKSLHIGHNNFQGGFPKYLTNCSFLEELNMTKTSLTGQIPDLSPLQSLKLLDLSCNQLTGDFPLSIINLTNLVILNFNENRHFNPWRLPEDISRLINLKWMILTACNMHGTIPVSISNMTSLVDLELSANRLVGKVPRELGKLKNLKLLELFYNLLDGEIPAELGNLTELVDLDMSANNFTGRIPESISRLPKLQVLQLYHNALSGEFPAALANSTTLTILSLYDNLFTGEVPQHFGLSSALLALDLSENRFSGKLPPFLCSGGKLSYILLLQNMFSGELPDGYVKCQSVLRFRVNYNQLEGRIPQELFTLPHVSIIDLSYNHFSGPIPTTIGSARNLSELFMQSNKLSGLLPYEISTSSNLVKLDLSNNLLYGPIPSEIGGLKSLNLLLLQGNKFNSSIPESLSSLKYLNYLDLSNNLLIGKIPESLGELLPNSMNLSNNLLSGAIPLLFIKGGVLESFLGNPGLCVPTSLNSSNTSFQTCSHSYNHKKRNNIVWVIGTSVGIVIVGLVLFIKRWFGNKKAVMEQDDHSLSSSFFSFDVKSFHRLSFDQREIFEAMVEKNIVGYGGSGAVYKIELSNGGVVAAKKLWSHKHKHSVSEDKLVLDKELKTEVETLGNIRHKNIVKLYCYFSSLDCSLLVYEYMPNGNLWHALHGGKFVLDWPIRHQIALGIAQGLAYLHHDLMPPIIHRDIKSTNILLDIDYQPKVADFGIAKVLQARGGKDSSTTVIAGTYGYLAPEYAYSSKATTKCDVYSFGVVLMELITGKKPVEPEFGDNKNIVYWVSTKVETKEGAFEVLDKKVSDSFKEDMIKVLRIAIRCTYSTPTLRPTMNEVVQLLIDADPCKFNCCNMSNKKKNDTEDQLINKPPKNIYEL